MNKLYKYTFGFLAILALIIACTKEVGLYTEVEFEISETHVADGFINTPLATSITVTPEELVEGYSYSYSYKINTGEGYFQDESGATIAEGDKIGLIPLSASLNYIATKIGDHSITFTAEDTFGFQEQVTASYAISDVPVTWTVIGPTGQVLLGSSQDITVTLGSETTGVGVTYERNYSFTQGTGNLTSSPSGASEALNEFVSITPGTYALTYVATELVQTTLEFLLKDSNGQEIVQTISFEVVNELSSEKEITSFIVNGVAGTINGTTIDVVLPEGTDVTALAPIIIHTGVSISPESETSQDFTNPVIYTVTAQDQTIQEYTVTLTVEGNEAKDITDFAIDGVDGIITGTNISVTLPAGTDVTALSPTIVHEGSSINPASGVAQDFSSPVEYTVTAADGTTQVYTVTVSLAPTLSSDKDITTFTIDGVLVNNPVIAFTITLPAGTDVTTLSPTIMHEGSSINPASGVIQNFTSPVEYTVTAADGTTQVYTVTVSLAPALSDEKNITSFTIDGEVVNNPASAFTITLPSGTDVTALSPTLAHTGASVNPASAVAQNFTSPVEYTVTAADGTTKMYIVTVSLAPALSSAKDITLFTIDGEMVNNPATAFTITLPAGTDVTALSPSITHTGASINPASGVAQDFTSPVEYTVTAADGSTQVYTVTVNLAAPVNEAPIAQADIFTVIENSSNNTLDVLNNDSDADGTVLTIIAVDTPINGSATIAPGGQSILYNATNGNDRFNYTIEDEDGATTAATIDINVVPNQNPTVEIDDRILIPRTDYPRTVTFNVASSGDTDGTIENYEWNFGDSGSTGNIINNTNPTATSHTFDGPETYDVVLTVTDDLGATGSDAFELILGEYETPDFTFSVVPSASPSDGYPFGVDVEVYFYITPSANLTNGNYVMEMSANEDFTILSIGSNSYNHSSIIPMTDGTVTGYLDNSSYEPTLTIEFIVREINSGIQKSVTRTFTYCTSGNCPL
ncbi:PKD domain-containing protein [Cellulophaga sp. L1A9]|uniref:Ig-like domain-containing protein n=1 Tax=Cellulophaga sp. L1A9 TaxID=2686362 RepID=UPI001E2A7E89|nr:PKD domain-containing protein [Cellulophaga sp. L1A9]